MKIDLCASCGAEIIWVMNAATGKRLLVNAKPESRFLITVQQGPTPEVESRKVYQSHFQTCPDAAYWSGRSRSKPVGGPGATPGVPPATPTPGSPTGIEPAGKGPAVQVDREENR